ncbi:16S rRNA (cytosine(1402)-N(4))-methyltransferase RsmH [Camelimonas lactis]|uniref:Ribosomal RNA small subunit methyltransferase H n=1 Tax=Camelimonas lactis TaxID=659006 RepID=A0A4R2H0L8_9HYPH|nr:16S rRNA (cytosine(1402)-N(4))-methyltransferase RsmH [Camelimonas lactis]TCO16073.1 16S rRNA (cytosine1402-N4)-methyltransferase [Camelimonas lactis]
MTGHGDGNADADGGPARHVPVLLGEVLEALQPARGGAFLDGTFGAGGYAAAILKSHPDARLTALDRDPSAIAGGQALVAASGGRLRLVEACFGDMEQTARDLALPPLDGIVLDIGVSSMQLDQAERGFSFRFDGPLDMRMAASGESAADLVNHESEERLADIIYHFGEERRARAVARAIVAARKEAPILTTRALADLVARVVRADPNGPHPATRTFQALRIAVNDELGELVRALHAAERLLAPGGRLVVVTFHSLEDRIVKQFFARRQGRGGGGNRFAPSLAPVAPATFTAVTRNPVTASENELRANPRARSAKLRAATRTEAPAQDEDSAVTSLAVLPAPTGRRAR